MRILAVNQFYAPDSAATAQLLTQLCEDLVRAGDEVTVVASRSRYLEPGRRPARERIAGVEVVRPASTQLGRGHRMRRLLDDGSFWGAAVMRALSASRPDVLLALSSPPMIASGAALAAALRGIPLVCWVQDIYPDIAVALGDLPGGLASEPLRAMTRASLRQARRVVALSEGMAWRLQAYGLDEQRLCVIHNWADGKSVRPVARADNPFVARHGLQGRFVAMYSGTLGRAHDVATLIGAARLLSDSCPRALLMFVGAGARWQQARQMAGSLPNVRWLPPQPASTLAQSLSAAHLHLASLRTGMQNLVVPSKLYGVLAAGRPLAYVAPTSCEVAQVIREHGVGWVVRPGDAVGLAAVIRRAAEDEAALARRGEAARTLFEQQFDRPLALQRWRQVLTEAVG